MSNDCPACDLHHTQIAAMRLGGGRCDNDGCPMFAAQQISPEVSALDWLKARADWDNDTGEIIRTILNMLAAPGLVHAIALIEKRRDSYIKENCGYDGNGGHWWGTTAQEEYVSELDDIIELLRKDTQHD
jgi:hypothetical protein